MTMTIEKAIDCLDDIHAEAKTNVHITQDDFQSQYDDIVQFLQSQQQRIAELLQKVQELESRLDQYEQPCGECWGTGECSDCNGEGLYHDTQDLTDYACETCGGHEDSVGTGQCAACQGTGKQRISWMEDKPLSNLKSGYDYGIRVSRDNNTITIYANAVTEDYKPDQIDEVVFTKSGTGWIVKAGDE